MRLTTTDANAHEYTPEDENTNDADCRRVGSEGLSESGEDDQNKFEAVHLLPSNDIGEETETKLTDNCTGRGGNFDGCVRRFWNGAWRVGVVVPVDGL